MTPSSRPNRFLTSLHEPSIPAQWGLWCSIPSPVTAELCAGGGFDWLLFDMEHAPADIKDIYGALQAVSAYPLSPMVRPPSNDPVAIKRLLDIGVQNLLIPFVQTAEEAQAAVAAASYPPDGFRGLTLTSRANAFGRNPDYLTEGARQIAIVVQIETRMALQNLEAIAAVDGVAAVFLGPSDLSADLGHLGKPEAPEVRQAILDAAARLRVIGKPWGILVGSADSAHFYTSHGARFVAAGSDLGLLRASSDALAARLKLAPAA
ncbi:aldolase/citrate lyase family protein [Pollutimonas sp. H1-120]|uniref:aldolase/citrate lyase family protein n=1 Tax=Pollutimonas sp. H1-120 TaxID=3148824 RepID=UPI003B52ECE9